MLVNRFDAHCLFFLQVVDNMRVAMLYPHAEFFFSHLILSTHLLPEKYYLLDNCFYFMLGYNIVIPN